MGKKADRKLKKQQAMTAQQRRQQRRESDPGFVPDRPPPTEEEIAESKKVRNRILLITIPIILAIIIVVAVVIPYWYYTGYMYEKNPIAVMELSNGMTLRYEVFESDAHNSATNFLFLGSIGFFDGNIIHDAQRNWVHFGGYYLNDEDALVHRSADTALIEKTSKYFTDNAGETQFKYSVAKDTVGMTKDMDSAKYGLFGNYSKYCTEFEILGAKGAQANYENTSTGTMVSFTPVYIAKAYDSETENNIESILAMSLSEKAYRNYFLPPSPVIIIESVKVYNYEPPYGRSFEKYMTESGAVSSGTWSSAYL